MTRFLMTSESNSSPVRRLFGTQSTEVNSLVIFVIQHVSLKERLIAKDFAAHFTGHWINSVNIFDVFVDSPSRI